MPDPRANRASERPPHCDIVHEPTAADPGFQPEGALVREYQLGDRQSAETCNAGGLGVERRGLVRGPQALADKLDQLELAADHLAERKDHLVGPPGRSVG